MLAEPQASDNRRYLLRCELYQHLMVHVEPGCSFPRGHSTAEDPLHSEEETRPPGPVLAAQNEN